MVWGDSAVAERRDSVRGDFVREYSVRVDSVRRGDYVLDSLMSTKVSNCVLNYIVITTTVEETTTTQQSTTLPATTTTVEATTTSVKPTTTVITTTPGEWNKTLTYKNLSLQLNLLRNVVRIQVTKCEKCKITYHLIRNDISLYIKQKIQLFPALQPSLQKCSLRCKLK